MTKARATGSAWRERVVDITIGAEGVQRRLSTVRETRAGDLLITLQRGALAGGVPHSGGSQRGSLSLIKESRYTIRPSSGSPHANLIKYHYRGRHEETFTGKFWPEALKTRNGFAPVTLV